jgi:hypothetical protein
VPAMTKVECNKEKKIEINKETLHSNLSFGKRAVL